MNTHEEKPPQQGKTNRAYVEAYAEAELLIKLSATILAEEPSPGQLDFSVGNWDVARLCEFNRQLRELISFMTGE